jgi:threonine dehydrogenase-like Zn-dependent dehydrogenase
MKAATRQGVHDMRATEVPDPRIEEPTDAIIKVTSSGLCGSDLGGRPGRRPLQRLLRVLLDVRAQPLQPVRDDAEP